jgi:hypothetical protein
LKVRRKRIEKTLHPLRVIAPTEGAERAISKLLYGTRVGAKAPTLVDRIAWDQSKR